MVRPILRQRLSEVLVGKIHDLIVQERLNPGDRLPTEQEMAKQFGVSRLAVREATKALGFLGIIESSPRRGLTVGAVAFERVIPLLRVHPGSRNVSPEELIETRIIIETGALPHVMRRMAADQEVYTRIKSINDQMLVCNSHDLWIRHDIAFHKALLHESGLKTLVAFGDLLQLFFHRFRENVEDAEWHSGIESHFRILELLRKGNLVDAVEGLRFHISSRTVQFRELTV
jgi:GntR family transcriptional regulator, transcriptional repressor for pyruvate dehydrogenase complex